MALVGNLRLWTVQELVSSVLLCNHKSIQDETVRKVCENFQYLDMGIFVHILSGRKNMSLNELLNNLLFALLTVAIPFVLKEFIPYIKELIKSQSIINENSILSNALDDVMDAVLYVNQIYVDALKKEGTFTEQAQSEAFKLAYNEAIKVMSEEAKEIISKTNESVDEWLYKQIEIAVNNAKKQ